MAQIAAGRLVGRTELEVSREVRERLLAEGHELAEFAIVASGPNSASPHHDATERVIRAGEPIVLDIGGSLDGYCSDTTRTLWVTGGDPANGPTPEFRRLFDLLRDAQAEASSAVRPGVACERIDAVARGIITAGGHGPDFFHRVGHGIGLETHEDPYMVAGNRGAPAGGHGLQRGARDLPRGPPWGSDRGHRRLRAGWARRAQRVEPRSLGGRRLRSRPAAPGGPGIIEAPGSPPGRIARLEPMIPTHPRRLGAAAPGR